MIRTLLDRGRHQMHDDPRFFGNAEAGAKRLRFFHWPLEFVDVFARPDAGFDCILGNPPWERIKLQEQEFFAARDEEIAKAPNAAARKRLITALETSDDDAKQQLYQAFLDAKRASECESIFLREGGRFEKTGRGDINTYSVFAELMARGIRRTGRAGIIVPTGIATDDTNKQFFAWLLSNGWIVSLYDFENRENLFVGIGHGRFKFSLLVLAGQRGQSAAFDVAFFLTQPSQLREPDRRFPLSAADIALLNPNTKTCPIFRTVHDAELTKAIYRAAPVLIDEAAGEAGKPWGITFKRMFDMSNDSGLFRTRQELEATGGILDPDGRFRRDGEVWLPLYEAKLIHQFDHRFATYTPAGDTRNVTTAEHADPHFVITPRYWVDEREVTRAAGTDRQWFVGIRKTARATDVRTSIVCALPRNAVNDKLQLIEISQHPRLALAFIGLMNSFALDFVLRQRAGGTDLGFFILKQLPVLPPETYTPVLLEMIVPRVLELVYTAYDLTPFARDCGYEGPPFDWDEERGARLRAELDGIYAHLYSLSRDDFAYILDQFPIVRQNDEKRYSEFRTRRLCLAAYDEFGCLREHQEALVPTAPPRIEIPGSVK